MIYTDMITTDQNFTNFTSFADYDSTMNFFVGTEAKVDGLPIDLNDNEYIRIRAYNNNEKK